MNPILLKPSSEVGSQVIVQGRVYGNFSARDYYRLKPKLVRKVMESYRRLAQAYDLIVLEGAGSAVELNLKKNDLVNLQHGQEGRGRSAAGGRHRPGRGVRGHHRRFSPPDPR